jgi:vancomycin resistance protein YoaR
MLQVRKHLQKITKPHSNTLSTIILIIGGLLLTIIITATIWILIFELKYKGKIYPGVSVGGVDFSGQKPIDVVNYWEDKNTPFTSANFEFDSETQVATVSAIQINAGFDANLSAMQAYLVGRSGNIFTDISLRYFSQKTDLTPFFRFKNDIIDQTINTFAQSIDYPPEDALFTFADGKVTAFKPAKDGIRVNQAKTKEMFVATLANVPVINNRLFKIAVLIEPVKPKVSTDSTNTYGIKEQIGHGYSEYSGSIPGRIHNVALAASRFNGVLIAPGETLSFNKTLGDVSAATGYQQAYIIKEGRTVLGDGGGVCQVSTTLFRAAMDAGLPILERHAHAYRVHYYEEGGFKPGMDATVFDPSDDLKIKNDTTNYILIQTKTDLDNLTMDFNLYGASDGRKSEIFNQKLWGVAPPPPDLYQDDPTLKVGVVKQVDFSAWGAHASFDYKVTRGTQILQNTTFTSDYRPWQAIYLKGTLQ